jgi:hypothetical protein
VAAGLALFSHGEKAETNQVLFVICFEQKRFFFCALGTFLT